MAQCVTWKTTASGTATRTRTIKSPPINGGLECVSLNQTQVELRSDTADIALHKHLDACVFLKLQRSHTYKLRGLGVL